MIWLNKTLLERNRQLERENKTLRGEKYELVERLAMISRLLETMQNLYKVVKQQNYKLRRQG